MTQLYLSGTAVRDLAPLKDMGLTHLNISNTYVDNLWPLKVMKLTSLDCRHTKVTDLSVLRGMPLKEIQCDVSVAERNAEVLRSIPALATINGKDAKAFWKEVNEQNLKKAP